MRLITATNRDLKPLIAAGSFREDSYYRSHVFEIRMPSLRARREDVPLLVDFFISELSRIYGKAVDGIARDALNQLTRYDWPGNVRELRNAIEHALVTVRGRTVTLLDLPIEIRRLGEEIESSSGSTSAPQPDAGAGDDPEDSERIRYAEALRAAGGNKTKAAELPGVSRVTMWKKAKRFGLADVE